MMRNLHPSKNIYFFLLVLLCLLLEVSNVSGATKTSTGTGGNWNSATTWSPSGVPGNGDAVIIATTGAGAVQMNVAVTQTSAGSVTINNGATLNMTTAGANINATFGALTINFGGTVTMYRNLIVLGATSISGTINYGSTGAYDRTITFNGGVTLNSGAFWNETLVGPSNNTFGFSNNFTNNATTFTAQNTPHNFSGTGMTLGGSTATVIPSVTITGTRTNNGTLTVSTALAGASTLTNGATGTLNYGGTGVIVPTLTATAVGNVVNYTGAAQTVKATTYDDLTLSGTGIKTFPAGTTTVNAILSIKNGANTNTFTGTLAYGTGATLQYNTTIARNASTEWITPFAATGGVIIAGSGAITMNEAKVLNANVSLTINNGATLSTSATNYQLTVGGNFTNNGTFTPGTGTVTMNGAAKTIGGTTQTTFYNLTINNASGILLGNHVIVSNILTLTSGRLTLGAYNLTLSFPVTNAASSTAAAVAGAPFSETKMIVANGTGELRKTIENGVFNDPLHQIAFTFPVGDATDTPEYSPVTVSFFSGTFSSAYVAVRVTNAKHPNNACATNYLNRYWTVSSSGISSFSSIVNATYVAADVVGTRENQVCSKYGGSLPWIKYVTLNQNDYFAIANAVTSFGDFTGLSAIIPTVTITANPCFSVGQNASLTLTANPVGDPAFTYLWSPGGATTSSISPLTASFGSTDYTVTVTDGNGFTETTTKTVTVSKITVSTTSLTGFSYSGTGPSDEQSFNVSANLLSSNLVLTAPGDFEISFNPGFGFEPTLTIRPAAGVVNSTPIYVRLKAGLSMDYTDQNILVSSSGSTSVNVNCVGTVSPSVTAGGGGPYCNGTTISLSTSPNGLSNYYWVGPNGFYSTLQNPSITSASASHAGTYTVTSSNLSATNLVVNGTFEAGNTGFVSNYGYVEDGSANNELQPEGLYTITLLPGTVHGSFNSEPDHTGVTSPPTTRNQMVINGAPWPGTNIWSQSTNVIANADYQFTYWIQTVVNGVDSNPAKLQLFVNGVAAGPIKTADPNSTIWTQFIYNWNSGSFTRANLSLVNQNTALSGNDFALDDIEFKQVYSSSSSVAVSVGGSGTASIAITAVPSGSICSGTSVTFSATANGGATPSYQWRLNGASVGTNSPTYTTSSLANGNSVTCVMTKDPIQTCMTPPTVTSNAITMVVTALPTITTSGTVAAVCNSQCTQTTTLAYSATTNSPVSYYIDWSSAANTAGLADQGSTAFAFAAGGGSLNTIAITAGTPAGSYSGTMIITNAGGGTATQAVTVAVNNCGNLLNLKVYLEGPFNTGTGVMNTILYTKSLIPLTQPYNVAPWNYAGTESVAVIPDGTVDWVLVELRNAANPAAALSGTALAGWPRAYFLKSNGSIVDLDGTSLPNMGYPTITNLYVIIRHRNHLAIMSSAGASLSVETYSYDFRTALTQAHGGGTGYKQITTGIFGMVVGDIDHDGQIYVSDYNAWAVQFGITNSYLNSDLDMDSSAYVSDYNKWAVNFGNTTINPALLKSAELKPKYLSCVPE